MTLRGFTWFQGEANSGDPSAYVCRFPSMIADWRVKFNAPSAWFGFVLLEPWIGGATGAMRDAQQAALALPYVSLASAIDIGDPTGPWGSVHPRHKQPVGTRLMLGALALSYGQTSTIYKGPTFASASATVAGTTVTVSAAFTGDSVSAANPLNIIPGVICPTQLGVPAAQCGYPTIVTSAGSLNATVAVSGNGLNLIFTATAPTANPTVQSVAYGYSQWPVITVYNVAGLPIVPFSKNITATATATSKGSSTLRGH